MRGMCSRSAVLAAGRGVICLSDHLRGLGSRVDCTIVAILGAPGEWLRRRDGSLILSWQVQKSHQGPTLVFDRRSCLTVGGSGPLWIILAAGRTLSRSLLRFWCTFRAIYLWKTYSLSRHARMCTRTAASIQLREPRPIASAWPDGKPCMTAVDHWTSGRAGGAKVSQVFGKQGPKAYLRSSRARAPRAETECVNLSSQK